MRKHSVLQAKLSVPHRLSDTSRCSMQLFQGREAAVAFGVKMQLSSHIITSPSVAVIKFQLREAVSSEEITLK